MALYKYAEYLQKSSHKAFDTITPVSQPAPYPGIYRCEGCGHEIAIAGGHKLPPETHHVHTKAQGDIRWRLIVTHGANK